MGLGAVWDQMQAGGLGRLKGKEVLTYAWGERLDGPQMAVLVQPQLAKAAGERQRQLPQSLQPLLHPALQGCTCQEVWELQKTDRGGQHASPTPRATSPF